MIVEREARLRSILDTARMRSSRSTSAAHPVLQHARKKLFGYVVGEVIGITSRC